MINVLIVVYRTRDGQPISNSDKFKITKTKDAIQLAIQHVQRDDAGHYTLYAKTDTGETAEKDIELLVEDRSSGDNPPTFIRRLNDLAVKVGTRTRLLVEIRSASDVRVTWFRYAKIIKQENYQVFKYSVDKLSIGTETIDAFVKMNASTSSTKVLSSALRFHQLLSMTEASGCAWPRIKVAATLAW